MKHPAETTVDAIIALYLAQRRAHHDAFIDDDSRRGLPPEVTPLASRDEGIEMHES